ncbi:flippase-like domain-containing protein [Candidatus Woesearchaeota archaeon]|nr:flippase-like domain-containing protein [Candidatus Woesearchaeota archaeon]
MRIPFIMRKKEEPIKKLFFRLNKDKWFILLSITMGVLVLSLLYYYKGVIDVFSNFAYTSLRLFLLYILISLTIQLFLVVRWKIIIKTTGYDIPFRKLWAYRIIGYGINYFTPAAHIGGEPVRAILLKRYNVPFTTAISTVLIDKSIEISMNSFFAMLGLLLVLFSYKMSYGGFTLLGIALVISAFFLIRLYMKISNRRRGFDEFLKKLKRVVFLKKYLREIRSVRDNVFGFFTKNKKEFRTSILISFVLWALMFLEFKTALLMLGYNASITELFLIITVVGFAYIIPIPAALGSLELSQASIFRFLNISISKSLALSFLIRSRDILVSLIGMSLLFYKSFKLKDMTKKKSLFWFLKRNQED